MEERLANLRKALVKQGRYGVLISQPENRRYLSGFTGSAGYLFITKDQANFITDFRYEGQALEEAKGFKIEIHGRKWLDKLKEIMIECPVDKLLFEEQITYQLYKELELQFERLELKPIGSVLEELRLKKNQKELELIRNAISIADEAFEHILPFLKPGVKELDISLELEFFMRKKGASGIAFDIIVASGERSALPHGVASTKAIQSGDFVTMDFGAVVEGYHSDITRTVVIDKADEKQKNIYEIVLEAQKLAIEGVRPGQAAESVDKIARDYIDSMGYGKNFGHGLGHGVGLQIHEGPRLGPGSSIVLEAGMVVTIEPGIYIPHWGGVRIEDMVLVTTEGYEILTQAPKDFKVLHN